MVALAFIIFPLFPLYPAVLCLLYSK